MQGNENVDYSSESENEINIDVLAKSRKCTLKQCIKEGYLMKQSSKSFQRWQKRYFRLGNQKLYYAKDEKSSIFDEIDLKHVSVAETSTKNLKNSFSIITPSRSIVIATESRKEMETWMNLFKNINETITPINMTGQHNWYNSSHARPTYCNICREALSGVTFHGLSCEICKFKCHKRCVIKAINNCKWTTLASMRKYIIEDADNNLIMPHQWVEGNLPVHSKCSTCNKNCGSVLRLQDWRCLWCRYTIHNNCKHLLPEACTLGPYKMSIVQPIYMHGGSQELDMCDDLDDEFHHISHRDENSNPNSNANNNSEYTGVSPLIVFVNSKAGDKQGIKIIRRFKQYLNPIQVFDLLNGGPVFGLKLFRKFEPFRILICGGDGSISWVLNEIDNLRLLPKCQVGLLPLGTGNDLSRVLGWGSSFDDDIPLSTLIERFERASVKMLDRWSVMVYQDDNDTGPLSPISPAPFSLEPPPFSCPSPSYPTLLQRTKLEIFSNLSTSAVLLSQFSHSLKLNNEFLREHISIKDGEINERKSMISAKDKKYGIIDKDVTLTNTENDVEEYDGKKEKSDYDKQIDSLIECCDFMSQELKYMAGDDENYDSASAEYEYTFNFANTTNQIQSIEDLRAKLRDIIAKFENILAKIEDLHFSTSKCDSPFYIQTNQNFRSNLAQKAPSIVINKPTVNYPDEPVNIDTTISYIDTNDDIETKNLHHIDNVTNLDTKNFEDFNRNLYDGQSLSFIHPDDIWVPRNLNDKELETCKIDVSLVEGKININLLPSENSALSLHPPLSAQGSNNSSDATIIPANHQIHNNQSDEINQTTPVNTNSLDKISNHIINYDHFYSCPDTLSYNAKQAMIKLDNKILNQAHSQGTLSMDRDDNDEAVWEFLKDNSASNDENGPPLQIIDPKRDNEHEIKERRRKRNMVLSSSSFEDMMLFSDENINDNRDIANVDDGGMITSAKNNLTTEGTKITGEDLFSTKSLMLPSDKNSALTGLPFSKSRTPSGSNYDGDASEQGEDNDSVFLSQKPSAKFNFDQKSDDYDEMHYVATSILEFRASLLIQLDSLKRNIQKLDALITGSKNGNYYSKSEDGLRDMPFNNDSNKNMIIPHVFIQDLSSTASLSPSPDIINVHKSLNIARESISNANSNTSGQTVDTNHLSAKLMFSSSSVSSSITSLNSSSSSATNVNKITQESSHASNPHLLYVPGTHINYVSLCNEKSAENMYDSTEGVESMGRAATASDPEYRDRGLRSQSLKPDMTMVHDAISAENLLQIQSPIKCKKKASTVSLMLFDQKINNNNAFFKDRDKNKITVDYGSASDKKNHSHRDNIIRRWSKTSYHTLFRFPHIGPAKISGRLSPKTLRSGLLFSSESFAQPLVVPASSPDSGNLSISKGDTVYSSSSSVTDRAKYYNYYNYYTRKRNSRPIVQDDQMDETTSSIGGNSSYQNSSKQKPTNTSDKSGNSSVIGDIPRINYSAVNESLCASITGNLIGQVLLANADALCAPALPLLDHDTFPLHVMKEKCVMNNYFGIGLDAKISLDFHNKREGHPDKCSRTRNMMWYGLLGTKELLQNTFKNLEQKVHLECDGIRIPLPSLQGIVILNISSYAGGTNFWGGKKEDDIFLSPSFDDKILEVVAVFGSHQLAMSKVLNIQHHRIAQCRHVKITITDSHHLAYNESKVSGEEGSKINDYLSMGGGVPVQVDGEAWIQPPGCIQIVHKNRAQMLVRDKEFEAILKMWNSHVALISNGENTTPPTSSLHSEGISHNTSPTRKSIFSAMSPLRDLKHRHSIASPFIKRISTVAAIIEEEFIALETFKNTSTLFLDCARQSCHIDQLFRTHIEKGLGEVILQFNNICPNGKLNSELPNLRNHVSDWIRSVKKLSKTVMDFVSNHDDFKRKHPALCGKLQQAQKNLRQDLDKLQEMGFCLKYPINVLNKDKPQNLACSSVPNKVKAPIAKKEKHISESQKSYPIYDAKKKESFIIEIDAVDDPNALPIANKLIKDWSCHDVCVWLTEMGLPEYQDSFNKHDIRGKELLDLERKDFKDLGVTKIGHIKRISQAIKDLYKLQQPPPKSH
ncbi:unnamed protein product [Gordionus sp. m RMFG-2023]|uniref:uncharacterized protein LOC135922514 isoform X2 n=1 Tax=Gordionus sp. m RMFG-2023 TaxID=3053472 RepID=UPI0030E52BE9